MKAVRYPFLWLIRAYQVTFSGLMPNVCRYQPTCSHYTYEAIERFGVLKGGWLGLKRLSRCRPGGGMGYDPVPDEHVSRETSRGDG